MDRSRAARKERVRFRRKQVLLACGACLVAAGLLVGGVSASSYLNDRRRGSKPATGSASATPSAEPTAPVSLASARDTDTPVEVPNVTGRTQTEAELVLTSASFVVVSKGDTTTADGRAATVLSQSPEPGAKLSQGAQVSLVLGAPDGTARQLLVVLDPGHQAKADLSPEPVGPQATETKEKATAGASGVSTKRQESQVALEIAMRVKSKLEANGVQVVLTRTKNEVNLSNIQRAQMASKAGADLFVRIHADSAADEALRGVSVLYPGGNAWTRKTAGPSKRAAESVRKALVKSTGAPDGGIAARSDLAGFNWCTVPAILVETGYLSNAEDDVLLANPGYQEKVAGGMVAGIMKYLGR